MNKKILFLIFVYSIANFASDFEQPLLSKSSESIPRSDSGYDADSEKSFSFDSFDQFEIIQGKVIPVPKLLALAVLCDQEKSEQKGTFRAKTKSGITTVGYIRTVDHKKERVVFSTNLTVERNLDEASFKFCKNDKKDTMTLKFDEFGNKLYTYSNGVVCKVFVNKITQKTYPNGSILTIDVNGKSHYMNSVKKLPRVASDTDSIV